VKVIIFSTATCPYCGMLKEFLSSNSVEFEEKMVDQDEEAMEEMKKLSDRFKRVPIVSIEKEDGTKEMIIGFDKGKLSSILGI